MHWRCGVSRTVLLLSLPILGLLACSTEAIDRSGPDGADAGLEEVPDTIDAPIAPSEAPSPDATPATADCAAAPVEAFEGEASRDQSDGYPDHITATVTWQRTGTDGCVDSYAPTGTATYAHAVPGALCQQRIEPDTHGVVATDGALTIDRTTTPPTYSGSGATRWLVTWTCVEADGTQNQRTFEGGGAWFDSSGTLDVGAIRGSYETEDDDACGPEGIAPCTYSWSFTPVS